MHHRNIFLVFSAILAVVFLLSAEPVMAKSSSTTTRNSTTSTASVKNAKAARVNINTADAEALTQLPGIGPKTAKSIIAYRKKNGKFKKAEDLLNVKGIGEKTLKKMKPQLKF